MGKREKKSLREKDVTQLLQYKIRTSQLSSNKNKVDNNNYKMIKRIAGEIIQDE